MKEETKKMCYEVPQIEVIEIEIEDAVLQASDLSGDNPAW